MRSMDLRKAEHPSILCRYEQSAKLEQEVNQWLAQGNKIKPCEKKKIKIRGEFDTGSRYR